MSRSPVRAGSPRPDADQGARERPETPSHVRLNSAGRVDAQKALESALRAVQLAPSDPTAWEELERRAEASDQPEPAAEAYLSLLESVPDEHADALARRAHLFHEHWFGDDVARMRRVLARVLERCPAADWAFEAQVRVLTVEGDWQELLDAYDRVLTLPLPHERRRQLLVDVAHVAKDFADRPERAIKAVRELARLSPEELSLGASVARMLGERKQWRALVSLWEAQLETAQGPGSNGLRLQLAEIHLSELGEPGAALAQAVRVLEQRPGHEEACQMLQRVLAADSASPELRKVALGHLRLHHACGHPLGHLGGGALVIDEV